ncbi:hypothetical protein NOCA1120428 [metagenome]|uniref:Uncharacterized protein n=1 Tax=metagenome TaxID=256318 RepID=A0A2P2C5C4_9ZZZZ
MYEGVAADPDKGDGTGPSPQECPTRTTRTTTPSLPAGPDHRGVNAGGKVQEWTAVSLPPYPMFGQAPLP